MFENVIINDTTRVDILDLIIWGVTIAIILSILGFVIGILSFKRR